VHAAEQMIPLPLARRSVQTAPAGHVSPAPLYVQRPPGMVVAQVAPTEQAASVAQDSPTVRTEPALQVPRSHTSAGFLQSASRLHRGAGSLEQAHNPRTATIAATVRIRTVPPLGRVEPYHKTR
jgi:hypothetical protein